MAMGRGRGTHLAPSAETAGTDVALLWPSVQRSVGHAQCVEPCGVCKEKGEEEEEEEEW